MVDEQDSDVDDDQSRLPDEVQPNAENHDRSGTDGSRTFNQRGFDEEGLDRDWNWDERRS